MRFIHYYCVPGLEPSASAEDIVLLQKPYAGEALAEPMQDVLRPLRSGSR